jgi:hypothetical protein
MSESTPLHEQLIAEAVKAACVRAAQAAYERAAADGLCDEGAWEVAVDAIRDLDIEAVLRSLTSHSNENSAG